MEMARCLKAVLLVLHLLFLIVSSEEWYSLNVRSHASTPYEGMSKVMRIQYGLGLCTCVITVYFLWFRVFVNVRLLRVLWNVVASII